MVENCLLYTSFPAKKLRFRDGDDDDDDDMYEGWNFNSGNCLFTTDTK